MASIDNGVVHATIYLPDKANGFYQGTRFDWSGVISSLTFAGHDYYGPWFTKRDPKVRDFVFDGPDIIAGACSSNMGPAEEFLSDGESALGFNQAAPGQTFVKIGVGVLKRPDDQKYSSFRQYEIVDSGQWNVKTTPNSVQFSQRLRDPRTGYAYLYTKTLRLVSNKAVLIIDHTLKNEGNVAIDTSVYDHNFLVLDHQQPGPDFVITFPFQPTVTRPVSPGLGELRPNQIAYLKTLEGKDRMQAQMKGFNNSPSDYSITIENTKVGAGVRYSGNRPLWNVGYWSIRTVLAAEPFINIDIVPGAEYTWTLTYDYYTVPKR